MITNIKINGFKSFHNFEMDFTPFTVIAGANASGKSNLFDALRFLGRLAAENIKDAFEGQRGGFLELFTQYGENDYATEMEFCVEMLLNENITTFLKVEKLAHTRFRYSLKIKRIINYLKIEEPVLVSELLENIEEEKNKQKIYIKIYESKRKEFKNLFVSQDVFNEDDNTFLTTNISNTKTVLSYGNDKDLHIRAVKSEMRSWKFLDFNIEDLRQPTTRQNSGDKLTSTGKYLAGVLLRIKYGDAYILREISRRLQAFVPDFVDVDVFDDFAREQFIIKLKDKHKREYTTRVLSDGTLRILALCILLYDESYNGVLTFEEPENGIHPSRIVAMTKLLKDFSTNDVEDTQMPLRQVIVNTHSPVLVGEVLKAYMGNKDVSISLCQMVSKTTTINDKKMTLNVTNTTDLFSEYKGYPENKDSAEDQKAMKKYAKSIIRKYLETSNFTNVIEKLK